MKSFVYYLLFGAIILSACSLIDQCGDGCKLDTAMETNDLALCNRIKEDVVKRACLAEVAISLGDVSVCEELNSSYCYLSIAENNRDQTLCDPIEDVQRHDFCYQNLAELENQTSFCRGVTIDSNRDSCYESVSKLQSDVEVCYFIIDRTTRDICIARRAIGNVNSNECFEIQDGITKDLCYLRIAQKSGKRVICESIKFNVMRVDCLELVQSAQEQQETQ